MPADKCKAKGCKTREAKKDISLYKLLQKDTLNIHSDSVDIKLGIACDTASSLPNLDAIGPEERVVFL